MPNKNYNKGVKKEHKLCKELINYEGMDIAQRTAGSHGPFDIIAISIKNKVIKLVQSKPNDFSRTEELKLLTENEGLNGRFTVRFEVR